MKVFILGGTGDIGAAVVSELVRHGHDVAGLGRSERAAAALVALGAGLRRVGELSFTRDGDRQFSSFSYSSDWTRSQDAFLSWLIPKLPTSSSN